MTIARMARGFGMLLLGLSCLTGCRTAAGPVHPPRLRPELLSAYTPGTVKRVAMVAPRDFTPEGEPVIPIIDPLTGSIIRTLRSGCELEVVPGHVPDPREFLEHSRAWYQSERRARFPREEFEALRSAVKADAYLLTWVDRSSREWITDESLQQRPGGQYRLELSFVLLDPEGRLYWSVVTRESRAQDRSNPGLTIKDAVEKSLEHLKRGCAGDENWQLGMH